MHILGISCYFHDASAAILRDGELVAAAEEERFSRDQARLRLPLARRSRSAWSEAGITGADLDYVAFFEKPFIKFERILQTALAEVPAARQRSSARR